MGLQQVVMVYNGDCQDKKKSRSQPKQAGTRTKGSEPYMSSTEYTPSTEPVERLVCAAYLPQFLGGHPFVDWHKATIEAYSKDEGSMSGASYWIEVRELHTGKLLQKSPKLKFAEEVVSLWLNFTRGYRCPLKAEDIALEAAR